MAITSQDVPLLANFARSYLVDNIDVDTLSLEIPSTDVLDFPQPSAGEMFRCTIWDGVQDPEIVEVTANPLTGFFTIVRAQEGTTAKAWNAGSVIRLAPTKEVLERMTSQPFQGVLWLDQSISDDIVVPSGWTVVVAGATVAADVTVNAGGLLISLGGLTVTGALTNNGTVFELPGPEKLAANTAGGTENAITLTVDSDRIATYVEFQSFTFKAIANNTGATTINVNGLGVKSITTKAGAALSGGEILNGGIYTVVYDGTNFQLM